MSEKGKIHSKKQIQIIGQGTYGCVVRPEINCQTQQPGSREYLTKIQIQDYLSDRETTIGKVIKTVPNYRFFFAPIIEHCNLNLSTITNGQLEKCEIVTNSLQKKEHVQFASNKIQYIGQNSFADYFGKLLTSSSSKTSQDKVAGLSHKRMNLYIRKIVETHIYLLNSVHTLAEYGIVHLDIKENNIMHDDKNDVFILIDFGLSMITKDMEASTYEKNSEHPFGVLIETYSPWCIEIVMLSYIARQITKQTEDAKTKKIIRRVDEAKFRAKITSTEEMKRHCGIFMTKNDILQTSIFTQDERRDLENRLHKWIDGFKGKTWREAWTQILTTHKSWDNYGLAVMYLYELMDTTLIKYVLFGQNPQQQPTDNAPAKLEMKHTDGIWNTLTNAVGSMVGSKLTEEERQEFHFLAEYVNLLKSIILADPNSRKLPMETSKSMTHIFKFLNKKSYVDVVTILNTKILTVENMDKIKNKRLKRTVNDLENEKEVVEMVKKDVKQ